ncbi:predicted protein [Botrytis cinerea T4]|uniref:Uncharacterized protein n=1 Tax=Botryotinia fuckeliana (strain T4) TaxID=999810 RepID=G2YMQ8_BOTF4|nr:predicted protein [Botrytis cinerea T4]
MKQHTYIVLDLSSAQTLDGLDGMGTPPSIIYAANAAMAVKKPKGKK